MEYEKYQSCTPAFTTILPKMFKNNPLPITKAPKTDLNQQAKFCFYFNISVINK